VPYAVRKAWLVWIAKWTTSTLVTKEMESTSGTTLMTTFRYCVLLATVGREIR